MNPDLVLLGKIKSNLLKYKDDLKYYMSILDYPERLMDEVGKDIKEKIPKESIQIFVKNIGSSKTYSLNVSTLDTIWDVKKIFAANNGQTADHYMRFIFSGKILENAYFLGMYDVGDCSTIHFSWQIHCNCCATGVERIYESDKCLVCLCDRKEWEMFPLFKCGHAVVCKTCFKSIQKCLYCQ